MNLGCWSFEKTGTHDTEEKTTPNWIPPRSQHVVGKNPRFLSGVSVMFTIPGLFKNVVTGDVAEVTEYGYARSGKLKWPKTGISTAIKRPVQNTQIAWEG